MIRFAIPKLVLLYSPLRINTYRDLNRLRNIETKISADFRHLEISSTKRESIHIWSLVKYQRGQRDSPYHPFRRNDTDFVAPAKKVPFKEAGTSFNIFDFSGYLGSQSAL